MKPKLNLVWGWAAVSVCLVIPAYGQGTLRRITFDDAPVVLPGSNKGVTYYYEDSMTFTPIGIGDQFTRAGGGVSIYPENGSAYILQGAFDSLSGSRGGVSHFGLYSVDLSEFSTYYNSPKTVQFIGYRSDGTIVKAGFTTDGIIDGTGLLPDFQTFYFDANFSDLVKFEVPTHTYSLDNLVFFDVIPEPSSGALVLVGTAAFGLQYFRRKRRSP